MSVGVKSKKSISLQCFVEHGTWVQAITPFSKARSGEPTTLIILGNAPLPENLGLWLPSSGYDMYVVALQVTQGKMGVLL